MTLYKIWNKDSKSIILLKHGASYVDRTCCELEIIKKTWKPNEYQNLERLPFLQVFLFKRRIIMVIFKKILRYKFLLSFDYFSILIFWQTYDFHLIISSFFFSSFLSHEMVVLVIIPCKIRYTQNFQVYSSYLLKIWLLVKYSRLFHGLITITKSFGWSKEMNWKYFEKH